MGCTLCGGSGCSTAGLPDYGSESCCASDIVSDGEACSATQEAPCFIGGACSGRLLVLAVDLVYNASMMCPGEMRKTHPK